MDILTIISLVGIGLACAMAVIIILSVLCSAVRGLRQRRFNKIIAKQHDLERQAILEKDIAELKNNQYKVEVLWQEYVIKEEKKNVQKRCR